jgi:CDP-diacylglycerol--glycerol-3-phosphate 3-phosphatidyltransferase
MDYRSFLQKIIYHVIDPFIRLLLAIKITPNIVTALGLVGNLVAMWLFLEAAQQLGAIAESADSVASFRLIAYGGIVILAAGLFDMMDGRLARVGNLSSAFGALWDSTLDRYSELVTLFGICLVFVKADWFWMSVATFAAMVGSVMVSYVRARAEGLNIECKVGLMQRPERVVVTALAAIVAGYTANLWWLAGGMLLIAVLANLTAFWRIAHCYQELQKK